MLIETSVVPADQDCFSSRATRSGRSLFSRSRPAEGAGRSGRGPRGARAGAWALPTRALRSPWWPERVFATHVTVCPGCEGALNLGWPSPDPRSTQGSMFTLSPIGFVRASRADVKDDFWGGTTAEIELAPELDPECLDGIRDVLPRGDSLRLRPRPGGEDRPRRAPSAERPEPAEARHLCATREEATEPPRQHDRGGGPAGKVATRGGRARRRRGHAGRRYQARDARVPAPFFGPRAGVGARADARLLVPVQSGKRLKWAATSSA